MRAEALGKAEQGAKALGKAEMRAEVFGSGYYYAVFGFVNGTFSVFLGGLHGEFAKTDFYVGVEETVYFDYQLFGAARNAVDFRNTLCKGLLFKGFLHLKTNGGACKFLFFS